jgi:hypothetical protein
MNPGALPTQRAVRSRHQVSRTVSALCPVRAEGDAARDFRRLQSAQRARFLAVGKGLGQVRGPPVADRHALARAHLHGTRDDRPQRACRSSLQDAPISTETGAPSSRRR